MTDIPIPDPPAEMTAGGTRWQRLQSFLVLFIALVAIVLAAWEGLENRRHNRMSVQPRLGGEFSSGRQGDTQYVRMGVENTGLGPAVIKSFKVYVDGKQVDAADRAVWDAVIPTIAPEGMRVNAHAFGTGYFLPAGREFLLFDVRGELPRTASISDVAGRLAIDICYCSIYDSHCDRVTLSVAPIKTETCPL